MDSHKSQLVHRSVIHIVHVMFTIPIDLDQSIPPDPVHHSVMHVQNQSCTSDTQWLFGSSSGSRLFSGLMSL